MNAITYAMSMIENSIPKEVLDKTFISQVSYMTRIPVSASSRIKELVINKRVLKDVDIIGGTHITVPLDGLAQEYIENNAVVIRIPKSRTQGRSILTVHSIAFGAAAVAGIVSNPLTQGGDMANVQHQMLSGISSIPYVSEAQVTLLTEGVVMIQGVNMMSGSMYLRCEVENDSNLNNIKRRSYLAFGELCVLATKSYIYNNMVIPMDIGFMEGGATFGKITDIIDGFSDAETEYLEYLKTKWAKVNKLNDWETVEQLVRISAGGLY